MRKRIKNRNHSDAACIAINWTTKTAKGLSASKMTFIQSTLLARLGILCKAHRSIVRERYIRRINRYPLVSVIDRFVNTSVYPGEGTPI